MALFHRHGGGARRRGAAHRLPLVRDVCRPRVRRTFARCRSFPARAFYKGKKGPARKIRLKKITNLKYQKPLTFIFPILIFTVALIPQTVAISRLLGDTLYGKSSSLIGRQALHAYKLTFVHPIIKKEIEVTSPIPDDIKNLYKK